MKRFWDKVKRGRVDQCWPWIAHRNSKQLNQAYGRFNFRGRLMLAHRVSWVLTQGEIPEGKLILHRCDNPCCVNPKHLFLGTQVTNMQDMVNKGRGSSQRKTHCPRGHELTGSNLRIDLRGRRCCRKCAVMHSMASRKRRQS